MISTTKKDFAWVVDRVKQDDVGKVDYTINAQDIRVSARTGMVEFIPANAEFAQFLTMNDHALGQLSSRLGIPVKYARKCLEENPALFADHANHWLNTEDVRDKGLFMRTQGEMLRAVLSDRYSTLDNHYVIDTLQKVVEHQDVTIRNFSNDPKYFNLRLTFGDMNMNVGTLQKPDIVMVGFHITNSEVGSSSLRVDSCLYRLVCENGMIARVGGASMMAQRHANLSDAEMERRFAGAIIESAKLGHQTIDRFAQLQEVKVADPLAEIKELAKAEKYSERMTDNLLQSYAVEKEFTKTDNAFTLVNAFTRSAQSAQQFEQRLEMEQFAGNLMERYLK